MVKILLEAGAPTSKTYEECGEIEGNALTLAIAMHNRECVRVFLETSTDTQFWDAMNADIFVADADDSDSNMFNFMPEELQELNRPTQLRQSHLRLIIKHFPGLAKMALDRCMSNNLIGSSANKKQKKQQGQQQQATPKAEGETAGSRDFKISVDYTLLDDAFVMPKEEEAGCGDPEGGKNGVLWLEDPQKQQFKAESAEEKLEETSKSARKKWKLHQDAIPYSDSASDLKRNHPLMMMVNEQRTDLLGHPVCMALIRYKWNKFGRQAYIFTLLLNILFCLLLTIYTIATPAPYSHNQIAEHTGL